MQKKKFYVLPGHFFTHIGGSQESKGEEEPSLFFFSTSTYSKTFSQEYYVYRVFLILMLIITRLLLNEIGPHLGISVKAGQNVELP